MLVARPEELSMSAWPPAPPALPPAGWYADPANGQAQRWWSGSEWTNEVRPLTPTYSAPIAPAPSPYSGEQTQTSYVPLNVAYGNSGYVAARLSERRGSPSTPAIWFVAWSPAIYAVAQLITLGTLPLGTVGFVVFGVWVAYLVGLLLAVIWDSTALRRRNLPAASIAWVFLSIIAYLIARWVTLRKVGTQHAAPGVAYGIIAVLSLVGLGFGTFGILTSAANTGAITVLETRLETAASNNVPGEWTARCPSNAPVAISGAQFTCTLQGPQLQGAVVKVTVVSPYQYELSTG
jgi:hypothetical protein